MKKLLLLFMVALCANPVRVEAGPISDKCFTLLVVTVVVRKVGGAFEDYFLTKYSEYSKKEKK